MGTIRAIITSPLGLGLAQIFLLAFGTIQTALAQSDPNVLEYKGTVAAGREAEVAPRLDALLTAINFSAGQVVKRWRRKFGGNHRRRNLRLVETKQNRWLAPPWRLRHVKGYHEGSVEHIAGCGLAG